MATFFQIVFAVVGAVLFMRWQFAKADKQKRDAIERDLGIPYEEWDRQYRERYGDD